MALSIENNTLEVIPDYLWRNGELVNWSEASVHVLTAGHASVSSVFEGIKAYWNPQQEQLYVFRLKDHIRRFLDSVRLVRLGNRFSAEELEVGVLELLRANKVRCDTYIRPWNFNEGISRFMMVPPETKTEVCIDQWPFKSDLGTERGWKACVSSWTRLMDNAMPPRAKVFSNYHNGRMAFIEAKQNGFDTAVMLNERDKVAEGPGACIAIVRKGTVITPSSSSGILESITRDTFLQILPEELGIPVDVREVDRSELYLADEIFFMGTGREVSPAVEIDHLQVGDGTMGPISKRLDQAYSNLVRGIDTNHEDWRTPVW